MTVYRVTCEPWEHGLVLHIDGVGVTQTHDDHPDDTVETMARDYIALTLDIPEDSFDLLITPPETTAAIQAGYDEVERGETHDLGSFEQYLDDDHDARVRAAAERVGEISRGLAERLAEDD